MCAPACARARARACSGCLNLSLLVWPSEQAEMTQHKLLLGLPGKLFHSTRHTHTHTHTPPHPHKRAHLYFLFFFYSKHNICFSNWNLRNIRRHSLFGWVLMLSWTKPFGNTQGGRSRDSLKLFLSLVAVEHRCFRKIHYRGNMWRIDYGG
jgi:hypothetical protein